MRSKAQSISSRVMMRGGRDANDVVVGLLA